METVNGATVVFADPDGLEAEGERGPVTFGPGESDGAYVMMIGVAPQSVGPPLHTHPQTDEAFYVASGVLTFKLGDRELDAPAGTFVFVPRGVVHTAWNSGPDPVRGLIILSPGTAEHTMEPVED